MQQIEWKRVLTRYERAILASFAEALIPWKGSIGTPAMERMLDSAERHVWCMSLDKRILFRLCLAIFEFSGLFYYLKWTRMSRMSFDLRTRYLAAWHATRWSTKRMIKRFVEVVVFMNYYTMPEMQKEIGYAPVYKEPQSAPAYPRERLIDAFPSDDVDLDADVCVIGSGAGGAVVAKELAEYGHRVIVVEEGASFGADEFGDSTVADVVKLYRDGGTTTTVGWPFIPTFVGKCVGGTTVINSGTCFRTPSHVLDRWSSEYGLRGWNEASLRPYFERVEKNIGVAKARDEVQGASARFLRPGIMKRGHDLAPLERNAPNCRGSGICVQGCPTNAKQSVALNYIPAALNAGATLYAKVCVHRIRYRGLHATAVEGRFIDPLSRKKGPRIRVRSKVVVVACGTLYSPVLLSRSHIPDLSGQRGNNFTVHPASKVYALFDQDVRGWEGIPQGYYCDALANEGIKFEGIFLSPSFTASTVLLTGAAHREVMENYRHLACFGLMVTDTTRGKILRGISGYSIPWYTINRQDLPKFKRAYKFLAEAFFEAGAARVMPGIYTLPTITREQGAQTIDKLKLRNKDLDLQAFHPLGSCRMGADPRKSVVDGYGRVYGMDNVFIADGSIIPTSLGVNPMVTIMAAAHKIADGIHREYL